MIEYILTNYKNDLIAMTFTYIGIVSIIMMFLPKNNIFSKIFKEFASIFTSIFKK